MAAAMVEATPTSPLAAHLRPGNARIVFGEKAHGGGREHAVTQGFRAEPRGTLRSW
jgi:hypothetical protein